MFHGIASDNSIEVMMIQSDSAPGDQVIGKWPGADQFGEIRVIPTSEFERAIERAPRALREQTLVSEPYESHHVFQFDATDESIVYVRLSSEVETKKMTIEEAKANPALAQRIVLFRP
jgi:hypothetical protein